MVTSALRGSILLVALSLSCVSFGAIEDVVPATADEDATLSRARIRVAGVDRWIHVQGFGSSSAPLLLVLHGSLSDHRALLPLRALSDRYRVLFWDQRGSGLSERIDAREYTEASIVEEIDAVIALVAKGASVTLVGHSFGAMYASLYMSVRPERVRQAALIEPGALNGKIFAKTFDDVINLNLLDPQTNALFWQSEQVGAVDHEAADYRALLMLLNGKQTNYHCDADHPPRWPVWRPGAAVDVYRARVLGSDARGRRFDFDFARGTRQFAHKVLFIGGTCSALGPDYQRKWNAPLFAKTQVVAIANTGHRLAQEDPDALLGALRSYLEEYRGSKGDVNAPHASP